MNYKFILNDIKKDELKCVYLCYGTEELLKDLILNELKKKYINPSFETLNYVFLQEKSADVDKIINACETLPFMSEKKIVVVENIGVFSGSKGSLDNEDELINYISKLSDSTCLIFLNNGEKIDNRKKIVKRIKEKGAIIELNKIKDNELNKWITKTFNEGNKEIGFKEIQHFIQGTGYLENNSNKTLYDLKNEIIKICSYIGTKKEVSIQDIDKILVKSLQNNIFKLVDGIVQRKPELAMSIFNEMLLDNEPVQLIMYMIIRQFRILSMAKLLEEKGYSHGDIAGKVKVPSFIAQKLVSQSRSFSKKELIESLETCLRIDEGIKTGTMDGKLAIEILIASYS